jgi:2-desacetyl-2-hydroxyethyl bacteriochlorophyllide A dehydrogenase
MKTLVLRSVGRLELADIPARQPEPDQLLVRTDVALICTSDLNDVRENPFGITLPIVIGHEAAGVVADVGEKVQGFNVGDRVATHPVHPCRRCANCLARMSHLCARMEHLGINMQGTFAEYYAVRADRARIVSRAIPGCVAALAEPVSVCLEALAQARVQAGDSLLVIGDGPFGVLIARLSVGMGLKSTVIAGRHDFRLHFAHGAVQVNVKRLGREAVPVLRTAAQSYGGYDAVVLAVGSAPAVNEGLALLRPKGRLVVFSAVSGETPVDLFDVHVRELEIVGACNDQDRFDEAVKRLTDPALGLADLVTHRFRIEQYQEAFRLAAEGHDEAMKVAIVFNDGGPAR